MKRKAWNGSGLYAYLEEVGAWNGSEEELQKARKAYLNARKRHSRKLKAAKEHPYTVWLTDAELASVAPAARLHKISRTRFIKQAMLAYLGAKRLDTDTVREIRQLLSLNYTALQSLCDDDRMPHEVGAILLAAMEHIQDEVLRQLTSLKSEESDN